MSKWLNTDKQLPEDKQVILFVVKGKVKYGSYHIPKRGVPKFKDLVSGKFYDDATHWQAAPEAPVIKEPKAKKSNFKRIV